MGTTFTPTFQLTSVVGDKVMSQLKLHLLKGAIARKRQVFEKMAQKSKTAFHWLKIRHWNALAHCARSYSRADA